MVRSTVDTAVSSAAVTARPAPAVSTTYPVFDYTDLLGLPCFCPRPAAAMAPPAVQPDWLRGMRAAMAASYPAAPCVADMPPLPRPPDCGAETPAT